MLLNRLDRLGWGTLLERRTLLERLEMVQVKTVELLADLKEKDAEDQHGDQHIERDSEFHDPRHAVGRTHGPEEKPVLHREKAHNLRHRLASRDHRDEG